MALEKTRNLSHLHPLEIMRSEPLGSYLVYTTWVRLYVGNIMRPSIMFVTLFFVFPLGSFLIIIIQRRSRSYVAIGFSTSCSKKYQGHLKLLGFRILYREDDETAVFAKYHQTEIEINFACTTPTFSYLY